VLEPWAGTGVDAELWSLCRAQLPVYARPASIEHVASLPKNPAGKILRHRIRASVGSQRNVALFGEPVPTAS
jgi:acyl-coenzyme A synthetase/AMP-(fatty) acid ligase